MPQIVVERLVKTFQVAERTPGLWGAVRGLVRRRHHAVRALDGVSFSIERGELVGYIGPNGAGKSTTVKALAGILVPDAGRCEVAGRVPWHQRIAHMAEIGVVFGQRTQLWWDFPVVESFERPDRCPQRPTGTPVRQRPDWICEVVSPGNATDDTIKKLRLYHRAAIPHYWIVDPRDATLTVMRWSNPQRRWLCDADTCRARRDRAAGAVPRGRALDRHVVRR